jgi:aryl-alcohol dehydrogenase
MQITAAVLRSKAHPFHLETVELDAPRADEVLVRMVGVGICHTDLSMRDSPFTLPVVLGHEGAGVVDLVGERVTKVKPGDHVVLTFSSCGGCPNCQRGQPAYCAHAFDSTFTGTRADGSSTLHQGNEIVHGCFFGQSSFATYALAGERNVVKVRQDAPLAALGPLGCGIQTGAGAVMNSLAVRSGSSLAVFGTGSVGLSAIMAARVVGCTTIIGVDVNPTRLQLAGELGATHTIDAREADVLATIQQLTGGGADYTLETTALPKVFRQAVEALRPLGVCGLIGAAPYGTEVTFDMTSLLMGRAIRGILEGDSVPDLFIPRLIDLYLQGRFPFDRLISYYDLAQINEAAADAEAGRVIKPVLRMVYHTMA